MPAQNLDIVGTAAVDVVPIAPNFHERLRALVLPGADRLGNDLGQAIARSMALQIAQAIPRAVSDGFRVARADAVRQGSSTGGAFADSLRAKLEAAFRAMPKLDVGLGDTGVDASLARLRSKLEALRNKRIGIDISVEDANAKVSEIDDRLARLGASSPNVRVRVDVATARAALADLQAEIRAASASPLTIEARVGEFRASLVARVEEAQAGLPVIDINADTEPARQELDRYRAQLQAIPIRLRTDATFDDAAALAEIAHIQERLDRLSHSSAAVDVRVDAARASADLAAIAAEVEALDAQRVNINVDTSAASGAILALSVSIAALSAGPAIPILAAGVGGLAAAFTAAGAGAGAFGLASAPAIKSVTAAMTAQTAARNANTKATTAQANAGVTEAQQDVQMASARQGLATAERSAAQSIYSARQQIAAADRAEVAAIQNAADQKKTALAGVTSAELALSDAQRSARDAEDALVRARTTAAQQLRDLNNQLTDSALNSRQASLRVQRTHLDLLTAQQNPNTPPLNLADAQLAFDQAVQAQKEQAQSQVDLQKSAAAQTKAGVDGNLAVKQAAEQLAKAQENVAAKTLAVAAATANVAKVAKTSAQAIVDAQRVEADAYRNAANVRAQAADSIASAERGIASAQLTSSKVTTTAVTAQDKYQQALAKLSPTARILFDAIAGPNGLKTAFNEWSKTLQSETLPIFTRSIDAAKSALPGLTPLVKAASDGFTILFDKASAQFKTPFWSGFKKDIDTSVKPAIVGLGVAFGNVFKGIFGIVDAFLPHMSGVSGAMDRITGRFADFGSKLKGSPAFEGFLKRVKETASGLGQLLGLVITTALRVSGALAPIVPVMFIAVGALLTGVKWLATNLPGLFQLIFAFYIATKLHAVAMAVYAGAMKGYTLVMDAYAAVQGLAALETWSWSAALQTTGIPELIILIVVAVTALTIGIIWAWKNVGWFRTSVEVSWNAIKTASLFLWHNVLKPTFDAIVIAVVAVGKAAVWLWENAIGPSFRFIWEAGKILATILAIVVFGPIYLGVRVLGAVFMWLWTHAISPAFNWIAGAAVWLWDKVLKPVFKFIGDLFVWLYENGIKPTGQGIKDVFKAIGDAASWLWDKVIKPVFQFIGDKAAWLYDHALKPPFDLIKSAIGKVADSFNVAKDAIKTAWDKIKGIASTPVKFVVDHVYNEGILPVWNGIANLTGVGKLNKIDTSKWQTGGILPGYTPGQDPHKFYSPTGGRLDLSGGEAIMRPEFTRGVGAEFIHFFNRVASTQGVTGVQRAMGTLTSGNGWAFAGGGILGSIGDFAKSVVGTAASLTDPGKVLSDLLKAAKGALTSFTDTPWGSMVTRLPAVLVKDLSDKALHAVTGLFTNKAGGGNVGSVPSGVNQWKPDVLAALQLTGQSPNLVGTTLRRMSQESGGNPTIVNRTDSNWLAGHPSVGLMQVIDGTFKSFAGPFKNRGPFEYGVSVDPVANIYASMKYALSRYGSLSAAYDRAGGYDQGGFLPPGDHAVYNHTGQPEPVFTAGQWDVLKANLGARGGPTSVNADVRVFVGDREITDIVRTEITTYDADMARGIDDGSRFL